MTGFDVVSFVVAIVVVVVIGLVTLAVVIDGLVVELHEGLLVVEPEEKTTVHKPHVVR